MLKICKNCKRSFRTYMPYQIFCGYDCSAAFGGEGERALTVDEILGFGGPTYGRTVKGLSERRG